MIARLASLRLQAGRRSFADHASILFQSGVRVALEIELSGTAAIVTGAGGAIGLATSLALAQAGANYCWLIRIRAPSAKRKTPSGRPAARLIRSSPM